MNNDKTTKTDHFPTDLFPNGVSFAYPDHMVRFANYYLELMMELTRENVARGGDRIPASTIAVRLCEEFGIDEDHYQEYKMIGLWVHRDRELRDLNANELRELEISETPTDEELREFDAEFGDDFRACLHEAVERHEWNEEMKRLLGDGG